MVRADAEANAANGILLRVGSRMTARREIADEK